MESLDPENYLSDELNDSGDDVVLENFKELPDGTFVYEEEDQLPEIEPEEYDFDENLAKNLTPEQLRSIAGDLLEDIDNDRKSREPWKASVDLAFKFLGYNIEEFSKKGSDFFKSSAAKDCTMSSALMNGYSVAMAELFPSGGPANSEIIGNPTSEDEDVAERSKHFMNYFLTSHDRSYYPDSQKMVLYTHFYGSGFRKVYQDPILNEPRARFVSSFDLLIDINTTDLLSSSRITEVKNLSRKDVLLLQRSGEFIDINLPENADDEDDSSEKMSESLDGISTGDSDNSNLFEFYESHVDCDPRTIEKNIPESENTDIPRPYRITICKTTKSIASIKRNWKKDSNIFARKEFFVHYYCFPGFGLYGIGLAHLMGSNSIALTQLLDEGIDAEFFKNFPALLKTKGVTSETNDIGLMAGEIRDINTLGQDIRSCVMPLPYEGVSPGLIALREQLKQETAALGSISQSQIPQIGSDAPVGTTMALTEINGRQQSSIIGSMRSSLSYELSLLVDLFAEFSSEKPYNFSVAGKDLSISKSDFNGKVKIIPVSDPNVLTSMHRLIRNESILKTALLCPELHDIREVLYRFYVSMKVDNIDKVLLPKKDPVPLDPSAENMLILSGKDVIIGPTQDDESHIIVHGTLKEDPIAQMTFQSNPLLYSKLMIHIQQHKASIAMKQLLKEEQEQQLQQQQMGMMQMGGDGSQNMGNFSSKLLDNGSYRSDKEQIEFIQSIPEVQNIVSQQDAKEAMDRAEAMNAKQLDEEGKIIDPNQVMILDIEQRKEAAYLRDEESKRTVELDMYKIQVEHEEFKQKIELEKYKAQLKFDSEMARIQAQSSIASEKNLTDLVIEENNGNQKFEKTLEQHYES